MKKPTKSKPVKQPAKVKALKPAKRAVERKAFKAKAKQIIKGVKRQISEAGIPTSAREELLIKAAIEEQQRIAALQKVSWRGANLDELVEETKEFIAKHGSGRITIAADKYPDRDAVRIVLQGEIEPIAGREVLVGVSQPTKYGTLVINAAVVDFSPLVVEDSQILRARTELRVGTYATAGEAISHGMGAQFKLGQRKFRILPRVVAQKVVTMLGMPGYTYPVAAADGFVLFVETGAPGQGPRWTLLADAESADKLALLAIKAYQGDPSFSAL